MLVLSRRNNERLVITHGLDVLAEIVVVEVRGTGQVRLGVECDERFGIHRMEVWDAIQKRGDQREDV